MARTGSTRTQDGPDRGAPSRARRTGRNGRTSTAAALVLAAGLALGGCGAAGGSSTSSAGNAAKAPAAAGAKDYAASAPGALAATAAAGAGTGTGTGKSGGKVVPSAPTGRSIIYTGEIQLRTSGSGGAGGVDAAVARAEQLVSAAGGFIDSEVSGTDGYLPQPDQGQAATGTGSAAAQPLPQPTEVGGESAQLVLRIPVASYDGVYQQLLTLGTVLAHDRQAQDVTSQVVDISSRVKTQQASVARVRALMDRAQSIADVTTLEQDLTQREADLESLESQLTALQSQTAMSTVTVQLYSHPVTAPAPPKPKGGLSVFGALKGGWHALYETVRAVLIALAAALPFLVPLALLLWLGRVLFRRRLLPAVPLRVRTEPRVDPATDPGTDPDPED